MVDRGNILIHFSGFLVGSCINEKEGYVLPTWARKITCLRFATESSSRHQSKSEEVWPNIAIYSQVFAFRKFIPLDGSLEFKRIWLIQMYIIMASGMEVAEARVGWNFKRMSFGAFLYRYLCFWRLMATSAADFSTYVTFMQVDTINYGTKMAPLWLSL